MTQEFIEKQAGKTFCVFPVGETLLFDKCVGVEPFEEACRIGRDHLHLREVDVRIDEARHDQVRPVIDDLDPVVGLFLDLAEAAGRCDPPFGNQQRAVFLVEIAFSVIPVGGT